jgi:hypothetical protein
MGDYFLFGSVFIKNNNQNRVFFKKTETGSNRPVLVQLFWKKNQFKPTNSVFPGLARFFQFGFDSVFSVSNL